MSLFILYGSQTGNAEDIARDLASRCEEQLGIEGVVCDTLNSQKKAIPELKDKAKLLVIVCSTTGNGDCPENGDSFWRATKVRSAAKDLYQGLKFTILGLGDTNYDKFCYMGKSLHKRIKELGGDPVFDIHCADEATGLEEVVEVYIDKVMVKIKSMFVNDGLEEGEGEKAAAGVEGEGEDGEATATGTADAVAPAAAAAAAAAAATAASDETASTNTEGDGGDASSTIFAKLAVDDSTSSAN
jgi:sulfite reductase alpha subunit-like flavoprotein